MWIGGWLPAVAPAKVRGSIALLSARRARRAEPPQEAAAEDAEAGFQGTSPIAKLID